MTLIAPFWPEKSWFADLLLLLTQPPLALPPWDRLLCQPHFHRFHGGVHALNLHAWRLSSVNSESQDFRDELRTSCPGVSESPLHACTSRNGSLSVVGVVEGELLRLALSYRVSHSADWKEVSFSFVPSFVAKTQDQSSFDPRFENFTVPALPKSSSSPNGRLLCPVRAVKRYLDRTSEHRLRCQRLFVTSGRTKKEISKNTVSWLRKVI